MQFLTFLGENIIWFMFALLGFSLMFRWLSYKFTNYDFLYYTTFFKEVGKVLISYDSSKLENNKGELLSSLLNDVANELPHRSLRFRRDKKLKWGEKNNKMSLKEYESKHSVISNLLNEKSVFESNFPPNYNDLATRVLERDKNWVKLFGVIPIEGLSRFIDILPGIFVILGILGTFIGISLALPEIAGIDFENMSGSSDVLSEFVGKVTLSMSTSIIGIICSLAMTLLNTLYPVKGVRNLIVKNMINTVERIWYSLHGGVTMEQQLHDILPEIRDIIKDIRDTGLKKAS